MCIKKVYFATDHAGFALKNQLLSYVASLGYEVKDCGAYVFDQDDDYPDFVIPAAQAVAEDQESFGIILGGSGQGEAIAANKIRGVRCAVFYGGEVPVGALEIEGGTTKDPLEIVSLFRMHNNANMISLGARFMTPDHAKKVVDIFLKAPFLGAERHIRRLAKVNMLI